MYVSLFGIWSKKAATGSPAMATLDEASVHGQRLEPRRAAGLERLVWLDKSVTRLGESEGCGRVQDTVGKPSRSAGSMSATAIWLVVEAGRHDEPVVSIGLPGGRLETVRSDFEQARAASGCRRPLYYPAGYEAGKRDPMIVDIYERLSDGVHRAGNPSERDYYKAWAPGPRMATSCSSRTSRSARASLDFQWSNASTPAVKKVVQMGVGRRAESRRRRSSWGGFDTTFLATHTDLFAAAVAGAPITDLISNYGNHHWSQGIAETDHIETGQQRMEVPLWEDLPAYIRNSAVFNVHNMKTPLLIEVGDNDGTVFWHQGIELYNLAKAREKGSASCSRTPARTTACARNRTNSTTTGASSSGSDTT